MLTDTTIEVWMDQKTFALRDLLLPRLMSGEIAI